MDRHSFTEKVCQLAIDCRSGMIFRLYHHHRLLRHAGSTQQQLYTIQTYSEIIKHKKIKMTKSEHYSGKSHLNDKIKV